MDHDFLQRNGIGAWLRASWRHATARRSFDRLDAVALRDLGMSASEFDSYWAESEGIAEHTRLRVRAGESLPGPAT